MPKFEKLPQSEAQLKSATGKRAQLVREYVGYLNQLQAGDAGRLQASAGETLNAVRRRLGAAAKATGKRLTVRRTENEVYFWIEGQGRKRGRPRKVR